MDDILYKKIRNVLSDIENYARYGAVFYDFERRSRPIVGGAFCRLCAACVDGNKTGEQCMQNAKSASYQSWLRGDAYNFKCWLGLYGIIVPVGVEGDKIRGAIEIGGLFPTGTFQGSIHQMISTLNKLDKKNEMAGLVSAFQGTDEIPRMDFLSFGEFMKEAVCSSGLLDSNRFALNAEIWSQQSRISGRAEDLKGISIDKDRMICFLALDLAKAVDSAERIDVIKRVDEFLGAASLESGGNMAILKSFIFMALSIVHMRRVKKNNSSTDEKLSDYPMDIEAAGLESDPDALCIKFQKMILREASSSGVKDRNEVIGKVLSYVSKHFRDDVKVEDVASFAGASVSTVMHKLKQETGMSFSGHLSTMRMKEAKRLLAYTDLSVGEIALKCGYSDQSYFSKVFVKHISMTPREFRSMLAKGSLLQS